MKKLMERGAPTLLVLIFSAACISLSGCANMGEKGYWGNYSDYLYNYLKQPNAENQGKYEQELVRIISISNRKRKRVPPGIYAELAQLKMRNGQKDEAMAYFKKEIGLYPESEQYISLYLEEPVQEEQAAK